MQVFVIAVMCLINLILWLVFFLKFKKLFTTDDEIQKTRQQYELLINDINQNTLSNINLIDGKIEELNSLIEIADRRLATINSEESFIKNKTDTLNNSVLTQAKQTKATRTKTASKQNNFASDVIDQDAAFEVNVNVKKARDKSARKSSTKQIHTIDSEGNAYGEVPVISPKIYMSENPIQTKRAINSQIAKLYNAGYTVEQISKQINKSTTEVQFIIDML